MPDPHRHWLCTDCGATARLEQPVPYLACPECNAAMRYDVDAELDEIAAMMRTNSETRAIA